MQLAGDNVFGPPETATKHYACNAPSIDSGINHIDRAQYCGLTAGCLLH
jgi:hypothetical protein